VGHRDRRDVTVKETHNTTADTVSYQLKERRHGAAASPLPSPAPAGKHDKLQIKIKEKFHVSPKKNGNSSTTTTTTTTAVPPAFPLQIPATAPSPVIVVSGPSLNSVQNGLPPLLAATDVPPLSALVNTPAEREALNGTHLPPPLIPAAEVTHSTVADIGPRSLPVFQYSPEHTYIAYEPTRFVSTPLPLASYTTVVNDAPVPAPLVVPTIGKRDKYNIRIREKLTTQRVPSPTPLNGTTEVVPPVNGKRQFRLKERIRTKA